MNNPRTILSWRSMGSLLLLLILHASHSPLRAQAAGVPIYELDHSPANAEDRKVREGLENLRKAGKLLDLTAVKSRLEKPAPCDLSLPPVGQRELEGRAVWSLARSGYLRIGFYYLCNKCTNWHISAAGGYVIAKGGIAATCHHLLARETTNMKEGYLFAADDSGAVFPVTELLAVQSEQDIVIVRTGAIHLKPLPLNTDVSPGDTVYLLSDPKNNRGYFSSGIVNRFIKSKVDGKDVIQINVGTDWCPGSSGAAILDRFGNVVGHVSSISTVTEPMGAGDGKGRQGQETMIVFHTAVRAADVLALLKSK